jgi:hypothetical protein
MGPGPWKPNAARVMARSLVLTDSISPLDREWRRDASVPGRYWRILRPSSVNWGMRQRAAQASHLSSARAARRGCPLSLKMTRSPSLSRYARCR